jgi:hypothetical protein
MQATRCPVGFRREDFKKENRANHAVRGTEKDGKIVVCKLN